jgi:ABC-type transport system involved in cytochrome c biogenesis permease subunit
MLTYGLMLRGTIAGRLPAANMFESLLFLSWGMGAFAILAIFFFRHRSVPLTASTMGALSLFLADTLPMNHFISPIAPVLMDTVWMSIHVPVIMVSYSVLALAVLIAHTQVVVMAAAPGRKKVIDSIDRVHYWYVSVGALLLFIGIVTGSMWAASSWGRYWGWDPKEVWSLIAFLGYMSIIHVHVNNEKIPRWAYGAGAVLGLAVFVLVLSKMAPFTVWSLLAFAAAGGAMVFFVSARGRLATAVKSILAFWMIIMTYVGVNYVLGIGLHSYGFGTGAIASRVFMIGTIDLSLVAVCSLIYLARIYKVSGASESSAMRQG